jgi:hypothetical protein
MKKAEPESDDWLRPEYNKAELGELVRGKYAQRLRETTNVVVIEPRLAEAFPNDEAVNNALRGLLDLAESAIRSPKRPRTSGSKATKAG